MLTLEQFLADPSLVTGLKYGSKVTLACSRPGCGETVVKARHRIHKAVHEGQTQTYCSRRCRGAHQRERQTTTVEGVAGRVCRICGAWSPLDKMTAKGRGRVCRLCKRNQPAQRFSVLRSKAKARGLTWDLSFDEFQSLWGNSCYYCGDPIDTIGLDRIDSAQGYTQENVVPCCGVCNRGKLYQAQDQFLARCRRVAEASPKAIWSLTID